MKEQERRLATVAWVQSLAPWEVFATYTWRLKIPYDNRPWMPRRDATGVNIWQAQRAMEQFHRKRELRGVSFFTAIEKNPGTDGFHVHEMWADCGGVRRSDIWAQWFEAHGRNRIEPIRSTTQVEGYCAKYVTKFDCWWWPDLQWHRVQSLQKRGFTLCDLASAASAARPVASGGTVAA